MSRLVLISYDIREPKRLRRVYRLMRGFGEHTQYSIFLCTLTPARRQLLEAKLAAIIAGDDQVLFVDLGPEGEHARARISSMGGLSESLSDTSPPSSPESTLRC